GARDEVVQQLRGARRIVLTVADVRCVVEVCEVRREAIDEEYLLARFRVRADHGVLGVRKPRLQRVALLDGHPRTEARFDRMPGKQALDRRLHVIGKILVSARHVCPDRVAADRGGFDAAQHCTEWRFFTPGGVAMPGIFVMVGRRVEVLVNADQTWMIGIAAGNRMVFEIAEAPRELDMFSLADLLILKEQHLMSQQSLTDGSKQIVVADRFGEANPAKFRTDVRREFLDAHQITKIEEPVVLPASMSLCAWTASSSS